MLVVIAIIAILAAILFPVFAKAREKARQASCQSNLKQLALCEMMYTSDYDERSHGPTQNPTALPLHGTQTCTGCFHQGEARYPYSDATYWRPVAAYIKNQQVWTCPSIDQWRSYGWGRGGENRKQSQFVHISQTLMFADGGGRGTANGDIAWVPHNYQNANTDRDCCTNISNTGPAMHRHWIGDPHNDGANIALWDGHVKWWGKTSIPVGRRGNGLKFVAEDPNPV